MQWKRYRIGGTGEYEWEAMEKPCGNQWDDAVGHGLTKAANSVPDSFNLAYADVWEEMEPLLELSGEPVSYRSREAEILALR